MKHFLLMILGCGLPILLVFLLPALGFGSGVTLTVFLVLMLLCHLMHFKLHAHSHDSKPREPHDN